VCAMASSRVFCDESLFSLIGIVIVAPARPTGVKRASRAARTMHSATAAVSPAFSTISAVVPSDSATRTRIVTRPSCVGSDRSPSS
jgi:hypothetical protein